jgi:hypothetical protein
MKRRSFLICKTKVWIYNLWSKGTRDSKGIRKHHFKGQRKHNNRAQHLD